MNTAALPTWLPARLAPVLTLSYPTARPPAPDAFPDSDFYHIGLLDGWMLLSMIALFAVARDALRIYVLEPLARRKLEYDFRRGYRMLGPDVPPAAKANGNGNGHHANGAANGGVPKGNKREKREINRRVLRIAEQGWQVVYYICQWSMGLYVYTHLPARIFDTAPLWAGYPHIPLPGPVKFYYLSQTAFYVHGILVLNAEAHRKDHVQMMTHHIITVTLMVCSYFYNFTRVGCVIMVLMDWCDIWLPVAKIFRYTSYQVLCDAATAIFFASWILTRHVFFGLVIWSAYNAPALIPYGWIPEDKYWFTKQVYVVFVSLLVALQVIQILWSWTIFNIAWRIVSGQGAADTRSDSEDDGEEDTDAKED